MKLAIDTMAAMIDIRNWSLCTCGKMQRVFRLQNLIEGDFTTSDEVQLPVQSGAQPADFVFKF